jgi:hypothetical protein
MSIALNPKHLESNQTYFTKVESSIERRIISPRNAARRSGLIQNFSKHDLLVWFGSKPPADPADWLEIPYRANCDIPLFFIGDIYGFWRGKDSRIAKIYEFYGD